jgi:predicted methyltransferase
LTPYCAKEVLKGEDTEKMQESSEVKFDSLMQKDDDEYIYRLAGVNIHRGNADHGHYWSLINTDRGEKEPDPYVDEAKWKNIEKNS